jgi:hypothetical protein
MSRLKEIRENLLRAELIDPLQVYRNGRLAGACQEYAAIQCAECNRELSPYEREKEEKLKHYIVRRLRESDNFKAVEFSGDPRGYVIKAQTQNGKGVHDWGGDNWIVIA